MTDEVKKEELEAPEGSEPKADATKGAEPKQSPEYEKTQQQLDQERANRKRIQSAYDELAAEKDQLAGQVNTLTGKLGELESQLKQALTRKEFADLANLDPDTTDVPALVKQFQAGMAKVASLEERALKAEEALAKRARQEQEDAQTKAHRAMEEEVYSMLDEEYGAQYRNEAIKLSDKWIEDGEADQPKTLPQGVKLLTKAYKEVVAKHSKAKPKEPKPEPRTDSGLRGLSVTDIQDSEEYKPGTYDQVLADMRKKQKAGKKIGIASGSP